MAKASPIFALLKFYATHLKSSIVEVTDFILYVKKYTQHHVEEQPELITFLDNPEQKITQELDNLVASKDIVIAELSNKKTVIFIVSQFVEHYDKIYQTILAKPETPFPIVDKLTKQVPKEILCQKTITSFLETQLNTPKLSNKELYCLTFEKEIPSIVYPSSFPAEKFADIALTKIKLLLDKDQYHEFFENKLRMSNPGKEIQAKNFFKAFVDTPERAADTLKNSTDSFYFFTQLCYFISQEFKNVTDLTVEDQNVLQSVQIAQLIIAHYKNQLQKNQKISMALDTVKEYLLKQPYYYSMETILNFTDSKGILLRTQYEDANLKEFLEKETSSGESNALPQLLVFKVESGKRYFIYKHRVFPLILRLCTDAHDAISKTISDNWYEALYQFEKLPEMTDTAAFEKMLEKEVETASPVLYALLHANFLTMLGYEMTTSGTDQHLNLIFANNELLPYSELLMIKQHTLYENAKIKLPFWYTLPVLSWFATFLHNRKKNKKQKAKTSQKHNSVSSNDEFEIPSSGSQPVSKKEALSKAAKKLEKQYVQEGSTINRELESFCKQWNKMLDKNAYENLREDVDSLVRDYMRKIFRSLNGSTFTDERLQNLAETLCNVPGMKKIGERDALLMYVKLYMLLLIKNTNGR
ncbi:MAG: hypothetical protein K6E51_00670 [Treponema sp.]|nr:hypothetical protein [Treponema sp.]